MNNKYNKIFKITELLKNKNINYFNTNKDTIYTINLINLYENIFTNDAMTYKSNYLKSFCKLFNTILNNFNDDFFLKQDYQVIDERPIEKKNNENVILQSIYGFEFVIKIVSVTSYNYHMTEVNISKFLTETFILTNCCPHFALFITSLNISDAFAKKIKLKNNEYIGIIYHNIRSWKIFKKITNEYFLIKSLDDLLDFFWSNSKSININTINKILFNIMFQIIYSLCCLSKYNISHNDLRPANILIHGGYNEDENSYDQYIIINDEFPDQKIIYNIPNLGFKIKIIDYGLSSSDLDVTLCNQNSLLYENVNDASIFDMYTPYYDIHCIINNLIYADIKAISEDVYNFLITIVNEKYVGKNNKFLNKYYRLGFPTTIANFLLNIDNYHLENISKSEHNIDFDELDFNKLQYENYKLIVSDGLKNNIIKYIEYHSYSKITSTSLLNMLDDPLDNNLDLLLQPMEAISLFDMYVTQLSDKDTINDTFTLHI